MAKTPFKYGALSAAIMAATSVSSFAQEGNDTQMLEEVVVTGIRQSLTNAMDIKRDASGVVDAISAEDIGKFPDTNLAESLQRVTGVSIDRSNNEGNQVTVRGFGPSFNLVTMNGRQMPNSNALLERGITRSFNFKELAAESVSRVEVYKTGKAAQPSGGIGATINVLTARPFDYDGFTAAGSLKGVMDTSNEVGDDITPEVSGMISHTFADGMFGALLSFSHAERDSRSERVGTQGWVPNHGSADTDAIDTNLNPERQHWAPYTFDMDVSDHSRERQNGQLVLQYAPNDDITATLDYVASRYEEEVAMNRTSFWFDNPNGTADSNGTVINPRNPNDELNFWAWDYYFNTENDSVGLNVDWQVNDTLNLAFDVHNSTSESQPDGAPSETIASLKNPRVDNVGQVDIGLDVEGDGVPSVFVDGSDLPGGDPFDPDNIVSDLFQERGYEITNEITQAQLDGTWENADNGALREIRFGLATTDYEVDTRRSQSFGLVDLDLSTLDLSFTPRGDFADEIDGSNDLFPLLVQYDAGQFLDLVQDQGAYFTDPGTFNSVTEETVAAYVAFDFETEFNDIPVSINTGVRMEETDVTASSIQNGIIALNYFNLEELRPVYAEDATVETLEGGYTRFLPNLDVKAEFSRDLVGRFSYSRTIARADISAMFPATQFGIARPGGPFTISQGNPNLLPYESENLDLSLEWYYGEGSYASVGYFKKYVENFIGSTTEDRILGDVNGQPLTDPSIDPHPDCPHPQGEPVDECLSDSDDPVITWEASTPGNQDDAEVSGWEINVQHMFDDTGFGVIANATMVDGDVNYDVYDFDSAFALTGLSDSANLIGFYEKDAFQVRLSYNWRDDFLLSIGQPQVATEPTFTEAYGQWDLNASYDITDSVSVFLEGLNITEETVRRHGRFSNQLVSAEQYGARYNIGIRAKF
ncbi:TonB-dependent receptor [Marinimicrobium sp. ARAG 43.8]|uniref:TonB-dependent receptor n=1 Tax=Marinimicrobium sp. ARAG 43.8 TaxID=3418719 RepID=UPI003CF6AA86